MNILVSGKHLLVAGSGKFQQWVISHFFIRTTFTGSPELNAKVNYATIYVDSNFISRGLIDNESSFNNS